MTQLDDLQAYTNLEMPRRIVLLTVTITGYDGNPNDGGAPDIIKNAPVGTFYLQLTPERLWRKTETPLVWVENEGDPLTVATKTNITVEIDPASTVPAPSSDVVFDSQAQVDAYLVANGGTSFKHLRDYTETLPAIIVNTVVINLVAGIHRPRLGEPLLHLSRLRMDPGSLLFQGAPVAEWDTVHAGGTIRAHQRLKEVTGVNDPYIDCDPGTFPNDESLNGWYAVFDNGYIGVIWEHTDERLWLCTTLGPEPVDDTTMVTVMKQATVLHNSVDDLERNPAPGADSWYFFDIDMGVTGNTGSTGVTTINNLLLHDFGCGIPFYAKSSNYELAQVTIDKRFGPEPEQQSGYRVSQEGFVHLTSCAFISTYPTGAHSTSAAQGGGVLYFLQSYLQGGKLYSATANGTNSKIYFAATVIRGSGSDTRASVYAEENGTVSFADYAGWEYGVAPTIVDSAFAYGAVNIDSQSFADFSAYLGGLRLRNIVGPCLRVGSRATLDLSEVIYIADGGGNTGVSFLIEGPKAILSLGATVEHLGSAGDVQFADGEIWTYDQIEATGPITDQADNLVEKV